jgi:hypothetical protein
MTTLTDALGDKTVGSENEIGSWVEIDKCLTTSDRYGRSDDVALNSETDERGTSAYPVMVWSLAPALLAVDSARVIEPMVRPKACHE